MKKYKIIATEDQLSKLGLDPKLSGLMGSALSEGEHYITLDVPFSNLQGKISGFVVVGIPKEFVKEINFEVL
jgi:hypothetical protein